jgi:hypothetical protein
MYKPIYDEKHRIHAMSTDPNLPNRHDRQKGIRERLLCQDCETILSVYEGYASKLWYGGADVHFEKRNWGTYMSHIEYSKFKLFQRSILWRAAVSLLEYFKEIQIGAKHEQRLREMIRANDPGEPHEYGCLMCAIISDDLEGKTVNAVLTPERISRIDGHTAYRFIFGGAGWVFLVSSHAASFRGRPLFLQRTGTLHVPVVKAEETGFFTGLAKTLVKLGKVPITH